MLEEPIQRIVEGPNGTKLLTEETIEETITILIKLLELMDEYRYSYLDNNGVYCYENSDVFSLSRN